MVFRSQIPAQAIPLNEKGQYKIVADSEVTGNHHVVDLIDGVEFFQDGGTLFMRNSKPTRIRCLLQERHDAIELEPNTWEFGTQKEYDYIANELVSVRD